MIPLKRPKFMDSKYFYIDDKGWHLKKNAPKEIKKEFDEFNKLIKNN